MTDPEILSCAASAWSGNETCCRWCDKPLEGRRRRWCSDACSWAFTRNHMWSSASYAAKERDGWACVRCGGNKRLNAHHKTPVLGRHGIFGCHHHQDGLETLCGPCHVAAHHGPRPEPPPANPQLTLDVAA